MSTRALWALMAIPMATVTLWVAEPAHAACAKVYGHTQASTCPGKLTWTYNSDRRQFERGTHLATKPADPYEYERLMDCDGNDGDGGEAACRRAFNCPDITEPDGTTASGIRVITQRRLKTTAPNGDWTAWGEPMCEYSGQPVPMKNVVDAVRTRLEKQVGNPTITAQPPKKVTLVNFVSLFRAQEQHVTSLDITAPVPGSLTATPSYTWDLDEGITDEGPGHAYTPDEDPKLAQSDDYYVKAKYQQTGRKNITLTLTWRVTMQLAGAGVVPLDPIVFTTTDWTEAKEKRAVLVND